MIVLAYILILYYVTSTSWCFHSNLRSLVIVDRLLAEQPDGRVPFPVARLSPERPGSITCHWYSSFPKYFGIPLSLCGPGSSVCIVTGYGLDGPGIEPRWDETGPGSHPAYFTNGTGSFPGVKSDQGVALTPHSLLVPWSRKSRTISLLPLWAVRPVQCLNASTFTITMTLSFKNCCLYGSWVAYTILRFWRIFYGFEKFLSVNTHIIKRLSNYTK